MLQRTKPPFWRRWRCGGRDTLQHGKCSIEREADAEHSKPVNMANGGRGARSRWLRCNEGEVVWLGEGLGLGACCLCAKPGKKYVLLPGRAVARESAAWQMGARFGALTITVLSGGEFWWMLAIAHMGEGDDVTDILAGDGAAGRSGLETAVTEADVILCH
jgi:hypothetical protein